VRSVVKSFAKLSFDQQKEALAQLHNQHERSLAAKRSELEQQLAELGLRAPKKLGRPKSQKKPMVPQRRPTVLHARTARRTR